MSISISKLSTTLLIFFLAAGCDHKAETRGVLTGHIEEGVIGLRLEKFNDNNLSLTIINRSPSIIILNGLFSAGYVQSSISYEFKNSKEIIDVKSDEISMPVLVNPAEYQVRLHSEGVYGTLVNKAEFAALHDIPRGQCHDMRAVYKSIDSTSAYEVRPSEFISICF